MTKKKAKKKRLPYYRHDKSNLTYITPTANQKFSRIAKRHKMEKYDVMEKIAEWVEKLDREGQRLVLGEKEESGRFI